MNRALQWTLGAALALVAGATSGCADEAYCFACGAAGAVSGPALDGGGDAGADGPGGDTGPDIWIDFDAKKEVGEGGIVCPDGFANCNLISLDGCEVNLKTDTKNCGSCGNACALANADPVCKDKKCGIGACKSGFSDCNAKSDDGCESATSSDPANCGGCGKPCASVKNGTPLCTLGQCGGFTCTKGFADCDKQASTGCEADLNNDKQNCGTCEYSCGNIAHGSPGCSGGSCGVGTCEAGYADCDKSVWSGCETVLATDVNHCGSCGFKCPPVAHAASKCENSQCGILACDPGYADCDGIPTNGCEVDLANDVLHCGACANACQAPPHATAACSMFQCGVKGCDAGWADCYGGATDGCETNIDSDVDHCGGCATICPSVPNGFRACKTGKCEIGSCTQDRADCNGQLADGCETDLLTDAQHCGTCINSCAAPPNAAAGCTAGSCSIGACNAGFSNCDGNMTNGCEKDTTTDPQNCGGCNVLCGSGQCNNSKCGCLTKIVLLADDSAAGSTTLATALNGKGLQVTQSSVPSYQFNGTNPTLTTGPTGFGAVIVLAGGPGSGSYSTDMPAAGQTAIANFVKAGNGVIFTEWAAKHVADGRWQTLKDLVLLTRTVAFSGMVTYKIDQGFSSHPIWNGLAASFFFPSTSNVGVTKVGSGINRLAGSPEAIDAVAIRDLPGAGRLVHVAHAGNYQTSGWSYADIQTLMANAAKWAARCN
jgi:hypothetical protein